MPKLRRLVVSHAFTTTILVVIIGNAVVLGLQTYPGIDREYGDLLVLLNGVCLAVFVVELTLRVASYVPGLSSSSTLLRLARLARVVRVVRLLPELRVLLRAVMHSLPPLFSMMVMTALILFVYGMVGWSLFGDEIPQDWGNIGEAMLTLFVMLTLENFPVYMDRAMEIHPWSWIYFVSFILVAALIVLNVLIGIVLNSMEEVRELERRRKLGIGETPDVVPAPVAERITILRAALDELEQELAVAQPRSGRAG